MGTGSESMGKGGPHINAKMAFESSVLTIPTIVRRDKAAAQHAKILMMIRWITNTSWDDTFDENDFFDAEESARQAGEFSDSNGENAPQKPIHRMSSDALKQEYTNRKKEEKEKKDRLAKEEKDRRNQLAREEKERKELLKAEDKARKDAEKVRKAEKKELERAEKELEQAEKKKKVTKRKKESERPLKLTHYDNEVTVICCAGVRHWKEDGSLDFLIDWLSDHGNYNRWKGGDGQTGETKEVLAGEISAKLAQLGKPGRTAQAVKSKITSLETGRLGLATEFSTTPLLTSDHLMDDSSDESSSKENETSDSSNAKMSITPSPRMPTIASPRSAKKGRPLSLSARLSGFDADRALAVKVQQEMAMSQQKLAADKFALEKERSAREEALHHFQMETAKVNAENEKLQAMLVRVQTRHQMKAMLTKNKLNELFPDLASDEENL
ncbi:hypothetical protein BJ741DRAFT_575318 [Chytriomyces cf. hyalinus JEL632]|nr:hypothetical protein BJ741DRAFT_575318 [Chytriomyces cf. hyalinus JEL632]